MKTLKFLDRVIETLVFAVVFGFPLFFAPFLANALDLGKQLFLLVFLFLILVFGTAKAVIEKKLVYRGNRYLGLLLFFLAVALASTFINTPNFQIAFASSFGPATIILGIVLLVLSSAYAKNRLMTIALLSSGAVLSLFSLFVYFLADKTASVINLPLFNISTEIGFSPTGSLITQTVFFLILIPLAIGMIIEAMREKRHSAAIIFSLINVTIIIGLGLSVYQLSTTVKAVLLPQSTAWVVAVETLKNFREAILGVGPGRFVHAFSAFKPMSFNNAAAWNFRFASSSNWYFQMLTELGLLGLLAYTLITGKILKNAVKAFRQPKINLFKFSVYFSLIILLIIQLFLPLNLFLFVLFFILLSLAGGEEVKEVDLSPLGKTVFFLLIFPLSFWAFLGFFGGKIVLANYYYLNSIKAANANDGAKTYNLQIKAISTDSRSPSYRIAYSQTNFALANSLSAKENLTDQDRSAISQLIQQAIREAKAAVAADPGNVTAWENLAALYRNLINFAEGADEWAVTAYRQAINLDPLNPLLRLDLGGLFFGRRDFNQAVAYFNQAVLLKPDLANAHYNLANALKEGNDLVNAKKEYETTLGLVKIDSNDYLKVSAELEEVRRRLPETKPAAQVEPETLSVPEPPSQGIKPPLELPNEGPPTP